MKILVIGIVASGKTTFAKKLSKKINIKYYEIDSIVHDDAKDGKKRTDEEQQDIIRELNENDEWILEGTLRKNLYNLLELADKVAYLDIGLYTRIIRIFTRFVKQKLGFEKCSYTPTISMLINMYKWTYEFEKNRVTFEDKLNEYKEKLIILNNDKEIDDFIKNYTR